MSRVSSPNQRMHLTKPLGTHPAEPGARQAALQVKPTLEPESALARGYSKSAVAT